jgi:hypothetical protein
LKNNECFGLIECCLESPHSIVDITCISKEAVVYRIDRKDFLRKSDVEETNSIFRNLREKLTFLTNRILNMIRINQAEIPKEYYKTNLKLKYKEEKKKRTKFRPRYFSHITKYSARGAIENNQK